LNCVKGVFQVFPCGQIERYYLLLVISSSCRDMFLIV
jgi:hypothetical protein